MGESTLIRTPLHAMTIQQLLFLQEDDLPPWKREMVEQLLAELGEPVSPTSDQLARIKAYTS